MGVDSSGGCKGGIRCCRIPFERWKIVGLYSSDVLDELVSESSKGLRDGGSSGGVGGCTLMVVNFEGMGRELMRDEDVDLRGMRGRGALAQFE